MPFLSLSSASSRVASAKRGSSFIASFSLLSAASTAFLASTRSTLLRAEQISERELVSDLRILAIGVAQEGVFTYRFGSVTLGEVEVAVLNQCVTVDGILCQNVLHASGAILILMFRTDNIHQHNAGRQIIGGFSDDVLEDAFRLGKLSSSKLKIGIAEPHRRSWWSEIGGGFESLLRCFEIVATLVEGA